MNMFTSLRLEDKLKMRLVRASRHPTARAVNGASKKFVPGWC